MRLALVLVASAVLATGCTSLSNLLPDNGSRASESTAPPCYAVESRGETKHTGWTEVVPAWGCGPTHFTWRGSDVVVPNGTAYASDGVSYFYAVIGEHAHDKPAWSACVDAAKMTNGTWVLLDTDGCAWAPYPGMTCAKTDLCRGRPPA